MATKLVIYLLFFGLYTVQIGGGQMTSDPAPGRSPGPPGGITTIEDDAHGSSGNIKSTTLLLTKDPTEVDDDNDNDADDDLNENDDNSETGEYSNDSELSKLNEIKPDEDDLPPSLLENHHHDVDDDDDDDDEVIPHSGTINVHSESTTGGSGNSRTHGMGGGGKPCVSELSEFLNEAIVVDKDNVDADSLDGKNASREEMFAEAKRIRIQLEVMHDMYDTKDGLNCGLLYRVRLTSSLVDGAPFAGEFFVETISADNNSKKRGHFVEHSSGGNKSPISWLKAPSPPQQQNNGGRDGGVENWGSENYKANAGASRVRGQGVTNTFQQFASQWTENDERNVLDEDSGMNVDTTKCSGDNTWHGRNEIMPDGDGNPVPVDEQKETESQNLWILNESCDQDDIVEFRIFFRPAKRMTINQNISRRETSPSLQMVVFKTVSSFKIAKDCQLTLRETSGTLNHTTLPFYSTDCTVHFPSFQMATLGQLPPGILVELTRLNVPCINGGYLKFSNHSQLCGKLEELSLSQRTHHFDVLQKTSIKIYKNPMFSLNYKLVDFCYNVSLSNESGQFYVRPTRPDTFECYFRIHLPYGNRIQLQLVTNNDSDVINSNSNPGPSSDGATATTTTITTSSSTITTTTQMAANDRDAISAAAAATTIYTSLGLSIETNIVNLSLSSPNDVFVNRTMPESSLSSSRGPSDSNNNNNNMYNSDTGFASDESPLGKIPAECLGVVIKIFESDSAKWTHCVNSTSDVSGFFVESSGNTLNVHLFRPVRLKVFEAMPAAVPSSGRSGQDNNKETELMQLPSIYLSYATKPIAEIVADCAFGWIALQQFCVSAIEKPQPWIEGEKYCASLGGHLASIRSKLEQSIIDNLLINSPGYHDHFAYWVGGSDKNFEGDFRWTDGLPFQFTNWFPGWSQHGNYNKQPNDDGLSSQDCIELRRYFRTPPGIQSTRSPMTSNFMWNDRDCNANNFIICERPMSDETYRKNWVNDCNKTVSLTKEHPRASVWSPSFPRQYPDNANCFTTITAPSGYRIVLEFEELVIESEPGCTYDYLEVTEPTNNGGSPHMGSFNIEQKFTKSSRHNNKLKMPILNTNTNTNTNTNNNRDFQKRSSYENPSLSFTSSSNMNANSFNNFNIAQSNYQNLLNIFSNLYKPHANFLIQTPDYPKGNTYYPTGKNSKNDALPKRLCGDWSSKLKLLRHISVGSYLGLHFVSDYSHHFGGYKAKAFMENSASECANERLRPYNGSCYLFVSYPEADWRTAQQVCNGMGAKLSSVSTADEHKFITSNIRNHIDYSPQLVYWLGAELEKSGQFEWTDDTKMSFQGWLPGQGQFDEIPHDPTCLGLQWKMSPTPMLPSGLYWQSQKCNRVGGYVCKKPKESYSEYALSNSTVMGTEGRLISPAYPNAYPHNIDYWIHIRAPERTRIIVQFQKIDLEAQDECLYDFISIQNYELVSKISLEPGTNPIPMAMFTDEREFNEVQYESNHIPYTRRTRSLPSAKGNHVNTNHHPSSDEEDLMMAQSKMQMRTMASVADIRNKRLQQDDSETFNSVAAATAAADSDSNSRKNSQPSPSSLNDNANHENKVLLNPKRHRRKNHPEIENKLLQLGKNEQQQQQQQQQSQRNHQHHHHLSKRSTILRSIPPVDNAQSFLPYVRWCGSHDSNMSKFDFVSSSNQVVLNFHSDYSVTGLGFAAVWKAIDMSGCPMQTLTSREGTVLSPNYPHFLLNNLNCAYVIQAPMGRRVWLEFVEYDLLTDTLLEVDIGNGYFRPFRARNHVNEGIFVSIREQIRVQLRTGQRPRGRGFQAVYHTVAQMEKDRVINLTNNFTGYLYQLNYPHNSPENVDFTQHLVAPFGDNILLELHGVEFSENGCPGNNVIEIYDNYADYNGTKWQLCKYPNFTQLDDEQYDGNSKLERQQQQQQKHDYPLEPQLAPVYITSYLNTLHIRQRTYSKSDINLNGTVRIQQDNNYKLKLASGDKSVESCQLNPCQFNGKCVAKNGKNHCQCHGHYTGRFCGLNSCELEPCVFGKCELTATNFKCHCQPGYQGNTCEHKIRPCADNPCEGRGACFERNGGYFCRCHAWWEGHRCERRMLHIPYKPLSERMLQEPFWLGLITVFVVLLAIGLVWCAKRHFPEKIEKLLAEEADRNRPPGSVHGHHHHTSLREQLQFTSAIPQTTTNVAPGAPRSIFNRLGIRKPSLLSLSSPNPTGGATARTFSLDDLLRPPPRRSPSPRKKRNNSTPVKKNATDKKQILQQLVSPVINSPKPKVSLGELIHMSENRLRAACAQDSESGDKETTFSENSGSAASSSAAVAVTSAIHDPKFEKKVTFARLLNKVSAEMSSGSEIEGGRFTRNSSALSLPTDIHFRASSMPPSPCTNDVRSPHSTSSNQGSDSMSSSDLALTDIGMQNIIQFQNSRNRARPKVASADSILAMFRNFASTTTTTTASNTATIPSNSSMFMSPSTTPTASSPQDDVPGDDESTTSSMHTPVSFSSGAPDSPVFYRQTTIEVPVLDALSAHKSNTTNSNLLHPPTILLEIPSNGINKCLSPIREMPTPIPSPALTPIMPRPQRSISPVFNQDDQISASCSDDDDRSSDNQISASIFLDLGQNENFMSHLNRESENNTPTEMYTTFKADVHKQMSYKCRLPQSSMQQHKQQPQQKPSPFLMPSIIIDVEPPTPEEKTPRPRDLIIPTLTVEQPSPTKNCFSRNIFPGSPPPQRASIGETSFMFPNKQQQKRLLKQFEKPTSLDLQFVPPTITITSNMSELESDTEPLSPAPKAGGPGSLLAPGNAVGMCYLSPFTMCSRADRTISESNLSSSGYSSMASPGPSRCGSSNPLCPNEMDEPGSGHSGPSLSLHASLLSRRKNAALASCKENITNGKHSPANDGHQERLRARSDSETMSDDILLESNDEGIGTDHVDEKIDDNRNVGNNNCQQLGVFVEEQILIEVDEPAPAPPPTQMAQLQLPSIVIQIDGTDKGLSPVSSRSESPLSERAGMGRFSPHFYGRKDQLPFTDSDGLYDFPSSDGKASSYNHQRRSSSKKRERKLSKSSCTQSQSPTKNQNDVSAKESSTPTTSSHVCSKHCRSYHHSCPVNAVTARKSPKRRPINRHPVASSSSSSESLTSTKDLTVRSMPRRLNSPNREKRLRKHDSNSEDDAADALLRRISPSIVSTENNQTQPRCKINRLRAIGNQIRFLRRLEKSIKTRERLVSPSDSCAEENTDDLDSPQATSPLLQPTSPNQTKVALCRQNRTPPGSYSLANSAVLNPGNWKGRDRGIITADDVNSD